MAEKGGKKKLKKAKLKWFRSRWLRNLVLIFLSLVVVYQTIAIITYSPQREQEIGITFSKQQASSLGLDWKKTYQALLDELKIKYVRLPIYWEDVEKEQGKFDFTDINWQLREAAMRNVKVTLVLGMRQPRWPECHVPDWTKDLSADKFREAVLSLVTIETQKYYIHSAVENFQVENEPLLDLFGECPKADKGLLRDEIGIVRAISDKPVVITASGELAPWYYESKWSDILGSTLYRITWSPVFGYQNYWMMPASLYRVKAFLFGKDIQDFWISELQMEPWFPNGIIDVPLSEQFKSMSPQQLSKNLNYAYQTNSPRIYLWGAEWWVYTKEVLKTDDIWNVVKTFKW